MPDADLHFPEPQSDQPAVGGGRLFQFSLLSVFVITTVTALILSIYFGVGRLIGMSTMEVVTQGLGRSLYAAPTCLVWIVGLTIAIRQRRRCPVPATLTIIALAGLVLITFVFQIVQMVLIYSAISNRISYAIVSWGFIVIGALHAVLHTGCWVLILVAVFARRTPEVSAGCNPVDGRFARAEDESP